MFSSETFKSTLCLPIVASSFRDLNKKLESQQAAYSYLEVWFDYLPPLSKPQLKSLGEKYNQRLLVHFRRANLDTPLTPLKGMIEIVQALDQYGTWFDFDVRTQGEILNTVCKQAAPKRVILSYHNYKGTPAWDELLQHVTDLQQHSRNAQETVIKVSCHCQNDSDVFSLLRLLQRLRNSCPRYCVLGMGEAGKAVRIIGALRGNFLTFAPLHKDASSAPGQFTLDELKGLMDKLQ